jgi:hypothetical protein
VSPSVDGYDGSLAALSSYECDGAPRATHVLTTDAYANRNANIRSRDLMRKYTKNTGPKEKNRRLEGATRVSGSFFFQGGFALDHYMEAIACIVASLIITYTIKHTTSFHHQGTESYRSLHCTGAFLRSPGATAPHLHCHDVPAGSEPNRHSPRPIYGPYYHCFPR